MSFPRGHGFLRQLALLLILFHGSHLFAAPPLAFDIPATAANLALREYVKQANRQILFPHELVKGYQANAVKGHYSPSEALDRLLADTGLEAVVNQAGVLVIKIKRPASDDQGSRRGFLAILKGIFGGGTDDPATHTDDSSPMVLEEVIVTANRRAENLQDVGLSVNAFNEQDLDRAGVQDISRLELVTPGLTFAQRGNDFKPTIRGANSENTFRDNSPPIGLFVDGVYKSRAGQAANTFLDVQRVEVLKGPQGTLFGRNTLGGAINVISNKPDIERLSYSADVTLGDYNQVKPEGYINFPLTDNFAVRFAGARNQRDGYIKNLGSGEDLAKVDDKVFRLSAYWRVTEELDAMASVYGFDSRGTALGAFGYQSRGTLRDLETGITDNEGTLDPINPRAGSLGSRADLGPWQVYRDTAYLRDVAEDVYLLEVNWRRGAWALRSITSYTEFDNFAQADADYSENHFQVESYSEFVEALTQELQISSTGYSRLDWVAGLYYSKEKYDQTYHKAAFAGEISNAGLPLPASGGCAGELFATAPDPSAPQTCPSFTGNGRPQNETTGVFAHLSYSFTEAGRIIAGIRYNKDDKTYSTVNDLVGNVPEASEQWTDVTWNLGLEYDVLANSMIYGTASTGFLSGGFNTDRTTFDQQEVMAFELGLKNRFFGNRLQLNVAAYHNDFRDLLASKLLTVPVSGAVITVQDNGGEIEANGVEIDVQALPYEGLSLAATLTWQHSEYGNFLLANRFSRGSNTPISQGNTIQLKGEKTPWAPRWSASFSVGYDLHTERLGTFTPFIQLSYSDSHYTTGLQQFDLAEQDAYTKIDLRLYWTSVDGRWQVQGFVENLTDEAVLHHTIIGGNDIIQVSWSTPRLWGIKLGHSFN